MTSRRPSWRLWLVLLLIGLAAPAAVASEAPGAGKPEGAVILHRMMLLVIQLGLILFAAKLGNILFEKLKMPGVLGELAAGMLIGPFALGGIAFGVFDHGIFPPGPASGVSAELYGITVIASVVLMFMVGLETDLGLLLRYSVAGGLVGAGGVAFSMLAGAGLGAAFGESLFGRPIGLLSPEALFLGIACTATSVGITARILSEKKKLESPEGVTILSAAVIDDVIGIILLAVVMGIATASRSAGGVDWGHIGIVAAKAVGVWLTATILGLLASRRISFLLKWFGERTSIAIMALGLALVLAGLFEEAGLAMIIGAYVMGLSLSRADISHVVQEKLHPIYEFLVPVFFAVMGMQINFAVLTSPSVLGFGLAYAGIGFIAKLAGCGLPSLLAGFNLRGAARIGVGMAPRGEVGLIIAGIGLANGFLNDSVFAAVIIMVVVNTLLAPPLLVGLFRRPAPGTRKEPTAAETQRTSVPFEFPTVEMAEFIEAKISDVFEGDGFFVHTLSRDQQIHQLRRDTTVIDFRLDGATITFDCRADEAPLVNTAMHEALAALEQAIRGMKEPLDRALATRIQEAPPEAATSAQAELAAYLSPSRVTPDLKGATKAEVIDELIDLMVGQGLIRDRAAGLEAVWQREQSMSTGLQYGVAIPHGRTDAVDRLVAVAGIHRGGIDFGSLDGEPSRIFVLTLSPKSKPAPHVRFMSAVSQVLDTEGRKRILACRTSDELYRALRGEKFTPSGAEPRRGARFHLADYLQADTLCTDLPGSTPGEAIDALLAMLAGGGRIGGVEAARAAVLQREREMPTGLENHVALPHGRTDTVDRLQVAVGVHRGGLDFNALDGKPTHVVVLVLAPTSGDEPYLQLLAAIIGSLRTLDVQSVLAAQSPAQLRGLLVGGVAAPPSDHARA